jgi:hypothetical protein
LVTPLAHRRLLGEGGQIDVALNVDDDFVQRHLEGDHQTFFLQGMALTGPIESGTKLPHARKQQDTSMTKWFTSSC